MTVKGWEPGDRIEWRHFYPDGRVIDRTGTVWDRAPSVNGAVVVAWVVPDVHQPSDLYWALAVGKATSRHQPVHGSYLDDAAGGHQYVTKGQAYASNYAGSPTGQLAVIAARRADYIRKQNARDREYAARVLELVGGTS